MPLDKFAFKVGTFIAGGAFPVSVGPTESTPKVNPGPVVYGELMGDHRVSKNPGDPSEPTSLKEIGNRLSSVAERLAGIRSTLRANK
jgi:hypothetical protein